VTKIAPLLLLFPASRSVPAAKWSRSVHNATPDEYASGRGSTRRDESSVDGMHDTIPRFFRQESPSSRLLSMHRSSPHLVHGHRASRAELKERNKHANAGFPSLSLGAECRRSLRLGGGKEARQGETRSAGILFSFSSRDHCLRNASAS